MKSKMKNYKKIDDYWLNKDNIREFIPGKFIFKNHKVINKGFKEKNLLSLTLYGVLKKDSESGEGLRPESYESYQIFEKDDLVFKLIDLENTQTSRVGWVNERGIMSSAYIRLSLIDSTNHNSKYYYYFYYNLYFKHIYNSIGTGVRSTMNSDDLLELLLPVATRKEQDRVVNYLDSMISKIDESILLENKKISKMMSVKKAIINEVF